MKRSKLFNLFHDETGSTESALVLIPLLTLFLIGSQLTISIHTRNLAKISAQDGASTRAISGEFQDSDTFLHIYSPDPNQNLDLVISHEERNLPVLIPGLSGVMGRDARVDVSGIAIVENQR